MPLSTSSSEPLRLTASDRPGVAQPVPQRDIPQLQWRSLFIGAVVLFTALLGIWEWHWRDYGVEPTYRNSDGLWTIQRRRIDNGEGARTVLIGASRMLFDVDLDTWQGLSGERPIQLALQGTSPIFELEDLASDLNFTGRLLVGVAPDVFFSGAAARISVLKLYRKESPSDRVGQWLSMHLIEPLFAFYDPDYGLSTVLRRQDWPTRAGVPNLPNVRRLSVSDADRNTRMWSKVEQDPEYKVQMRHIWAVRKFAPLDAAKQAKLDQTMQKEIGRAAAAVAKLRARGVEVIFVRAPSAGDYLQYENRDFPRTKTWDVLLARTGAPGIYFEDYPQLCGFDLPEWSHLAASERPRYTAALYQIVSNIDRDQSPLKP